ncbi:MAG: large repetitive protein, partial [Actinomycetota bacterium]
AKVLGQSVTRPRPNILLLVSDDQANSTFNRTLMPTVFREIVDQGIQFDRQYVNSALCCPSRGEMMTGLFEHNSGVDGNLVALTKPTIAEALHRAGYRTAMAGKYLNSHPCGTRRTDYDLWVCQGNNGSSYSSANPRLNVNGAWVDRTGVAPEILADYLKDFIADTPADQPFFAMYTPTTPHLPADDPRYVTMDVTPHRPVSYDEDTIAAHKPAYLHIPPFDTTLITKIDTEFGRMSRAVRGLDDSVKTILDSLGDRAENTLVVYLSDNGYLYGEHRGHYKEAAYEEAARTPMAVRFPAAIPEGLVGTTSHALVQNVDLAPTFADEAGLKWRVDGKSLMPLLTGTATTLRDAALIEHCNGPSYPCGTVRPNYLGVGAFRAPSFAGVVENTRKYVAYATGERELYDLAGDPSELVNLAGAPEWAGEQARLDAKLTALKAPPPADTTIVRSSTGAAGSTQTTRTVAFSYFSNLSAGTFVCRVDRNGVVGTWAPCQASGYTAGPLRDGDYAFRVAAVDGNGVRDATPDYRNFGIHSSGNGFTITGPPPASQLRSGTITFTSRVPMVGVECQLSRNGVAAWRPCSTTSGYSYADIPDGAWIFRVRGTNSHNVVTSPPSEAWFTVDNAGPTAKFSSTPPSSTSSQTADFAFGFPEPTTGNVLCSLDSKAAVACPGLTYRADGLAEGSHSLVVTGSDALGNAGATTFAWTVDRTVPVVTALAPAGTVGPNPLIKLSANESSTWIFRLDGGPAFDGDPSYMFLFSLADGPHTLLSRAMDRAGNLSPIITQQWTQQTPAPAAPGVAAQTTAAPTATIEHGPDPQTPSGTAMFVFTSDQPDALFNCALDGGGFSPCSSGAYYEDLSAGKHTFRVRATVEDRTGPSASWAWTVTSN